jgi:Uma2 family endonuclease
MKYLETLQARGRVRWSWLNSVLEGVNLNATMKQANIKFTYRDYLQLPDDKRYELVEGDLLLVPAPNLCHQRILRELEAALYSYLRRNICRFGIDVNFGTGFSETLSPEVDGITHKKVLQ